MMHAIVIKQDEKERKEFEIKDDREEDPLNICDRNMNNYVYHEDWQQCNKLKEKLKEPKKDEEGKDIELRCNDC